MLIRELPREQYARTFRPWDEICRYKSHCARGTHNNATIGAAAIWVKAHEAKLEPADTTKGH